MPRRHRQPCAHAAAGATLECLRDMLADYDVTAA